MTDKSTIGRVATSNQDVIVPCPSCKGSGKYADERYIGPCQKCDGDGRVVYQGKDAAVFIAAPELLQACREALADLEGYLAEWETDPALETVQELRAVIAKATGQD
jgi:RecJ-like exonuclease